MKAIHIWMLLSLALFAVKSCEKEGGENETKISAYHSDDSHNSGKNCMECHISGGSGEGWFTVAGTVYENDKQTPYPNATVRLYSGPGGTGNLKGTIEVDQKGNFYTTESIDFTDGLYATVEGASGTRAMSMVLDDGACNRCHGSSTDRLWVQ